MPDLFNGLMVYVLRFLGVVVIGIAIGAEVLGSIPLSGTVPNGFLPSRRFCVAEVVRNGDGPRHWSHASALYQEYNEDLI